MAIIKSNKSWFRQLHGGEIKVETKEAEGVNYHYLTPKS
jgi:hypothetical protein